MLQMIAAENARRDMECSPKDFTDRTMPVFLIHPVPCIPSHDPVLRPALQEGDDILDCTAVENLHPFRRLIGVVRRQHHLGARQ